MEQIRGKVTEIKEKNLMGTLITSCGKTLYFDESWYQGWTESIKKGDHVIFEAKKIARSIIRPVNLKFVTPEEIRNLNVSVLKNKIASL